MSAKRIFTRREMEDAASLAVEFGVKITLSKEGELHFTPATHSRFVEPVLDVLPETPADKALSDWSAANGDKLEGPA